MKFLLSFDPYQEISKPTAPNKSRVPRIPKAVLGLLAPASDSRRQLRFESRVKELIWLVRGDEVTDEAASVRDSEQVITSPRS